MRPRAAHGLVRDHTPEERFAELANLLARGLRALRDRAPASAERATIPASGPPPESGPNCLEVSTDLRLSVHSG